MRPIAREEAERMVEDVAFLPALVDVRVHGEPFSGRRSRAAGRRDVHARRVRAPGRGRGEAGARAAPERAARRDRRDGAMGSRTPARRGCTAASRSRARRSRARSRPAGASSTAPRGVAARSSASATASSASAMRDAVGRDHRGLEHRHREQRHGREHPRARRHAPHREREQRDRREEAADADPGTRARASTRRAARPIADEGTRRARTAPVSTPRPTGSRGTLLAAGGASSRWSRNAVRSPRPYRPSVRSRPRSVRSSAGIDPPSRVHRGASRAGRPATPDTPAGSGSSRRIRRTAERAARSRARRRARSRRRFGRVGVTRVVRVDRPFMEERDDTL